MDGHLDQNCPSIFHLPPGCSTLSAFRHGDCSRISCLFLPRTTRPPHPTLCLSWPRQCPWNLTRPLAHRKSSLESHRVIISAGRHSLIPQELRIRGRWANLVAHAISSPASRGSCPVSPEGLRARQTSPGHQRASGERMDRHPLPQRPLHSLRPLQGRLLLCNTLPTPRTSGFLTELDWPGKYLFYGNLNTASVT